MEPVRISIDGMVVQVPPGTTILRACDLAGHYVPRLCYCPSMPSCSRCAHAVAALTEGSDRCGTSPASESTPAGESTSAGGTDQAASGPRECGLCVVRVGGTAGSAVLACATTVQPGLEVITDDAELRSARLERLAPLLARHPHVCLSCPDREGCARDECRFDVPVEARCCEEFGHCEFGRLVAYLDPEEKVARRAVGAPRASSQEGRIRREPGLCLGCGRCVAVCSSSPDAGDALEMCEEGGWWTAWPRRGSLRASGCSFCGQCVLVCPAGAITAPGPEGREWLERRRKQYPHLAPVLPPQPWLLLDQASLAVVPSEPGVFQLADAEGAVVRIAGCADLRRALAQLHAECRLDAVRAEDAEGAGRPGVSRLWFRFEVAPLYTERETELLALYAQEHGRLPRDNDLGDDLFEE